MTVGSWKLRSTHNTLVLRIPLLFSCCGASDVHIVSKMNKPITPNTSALHHIYNPLTLRSGKEPWFKGKGQLKNENVYFVPLMS